MEERGRESSLHLKVKSNRLGEMKQIGKVKMKKELDKPHRNGYDERR